MKQNDCNYSILKLEIKKYLSEMVTEINSIIDAMDNEQYCLLNEFDHLKGKFIKVENMASSFYLHCYLSSFIKNLHDLTNSIYHLSERKHGALIVIQRKDPLEALLYQGIPIHATFTASLLESIFYPGNPLHDGAVLIREDKIVSAANLLPLSQKKSEEKLGTRHRAALGLTEQSDALTIVVSEETGRASFAYKGKLFPLNSNNRLVEV